MFEIHVETEVMRLPIEVRHEAVFELAKLVLWLEDRMIEKKTAAVPIDQIAPEAEAQYLTSPSGVERKDTTARILSDRIWGPLCSKWWERFPAISTAPKRTTVIGVRSNSPGVKNQHFSPVFSNRRWAGPNGAVRVDALGVDGRIVVRHTGYRKWGLEPFIYSQALEQHLCLIERDASAPCRKLLDIVPFSETDRRHWVAFLAAQMFRTPWFLVQSLAGFRDIIATRGISYPTDVASLRRAHETMFTNPDVFTMVYRLVVNRRGEIWKAPLGSQFVRSDHPVVTTTNGTLTTGLTAAAREAGVPVTVQRVGSMWTVFFSPRPVRPWDDTAVVDREAHARFFRAMLARGVLLPPSAFESAFLSIAHDEQVIDETVAAAREAFAEARR